MTTQPESRDLAIEAVLALILQSMPDEQSSSILRALGEMTDGLRRSSPNPQQIEAVESLKKRLDQAMLARLLPRT